MHLAFLHIFQHISKNEAKATRLRFYVHAVHFIEMLITLKSISHITKHEAKAKKII